MTRKLREAKAAILADWTGRLSIGEPILLPVLPALLDQLERVLSGERIDPILPPDLTTWSLPQLIDEICCLRLVLTENLLDLTNSQYGSLNHFVDRCLQQATRQWHGVGDTARFVPTPMCVVTGPEFIITFANEAYEKLVGRKVVGKKMMDAYRREEIEYFVPLVQGVYSTGVPYAENEVLVRLMTDSGMVEDHWVDFAYYPYGDARSPMRGVLALCYDVTDRVMHRHRFENAANRLKQTEEQLSRAMVVSKIGFFDWNLQTSLVHMNPQMQSEWGSDKASVTPEELARFLHPADRERSRALGRAAIAQKHPYTDQYRVVRSSDGKIIWNDVCGEVTYDAFGMPLRFFGTVRNITERKEAELKLAAEKQKFEAIFRDSPAPMALWRGPDFSVELVNPQFEKVFARLPALENQAFLEIMHQVYATGVAFHGSEIKVDDLYLDLSVSRVLDGEGEPYGVFSHAIVVTEAVLARKEAQAASLAKSSFLANMSHEIRTPLGAILGFGTLLKESGLSEGDREHYVDTIVRNGDALTRIIDDILDLAKVEAGRLEMERIDFSLRTLLRDVVDLFQDKARQKEIYLTLVPDEQLDWICSDPMRLRQILVNLIGNAVKFTDHGGVRVAMRSIKTEGELLTLAIDVIDTGIGLNPEQKERLFQPFVQADNTTARKFGGTGLGLALSQRLSQALGGGIHIGRCIPGVGSTFTLQFKAQAAKTSAPTEALRLAPELSQLKDICVLAVDDSIDNLFLVKRFLARSGARVETANDGRMAIEMASEAEHDIILMDIQMPEMDGYQTIKALRAQGYNNPVVALTAHAMMDERRQTHSAGFAAHLTKPLDARELLATIARLTQEARLRYAPIV